MASGHRWTCTDWGRKGNKNKEVGSNLWRWSSLPPAMFPVRQKLISLRHGGWVVFASELRWHYMIIDFISVSEWGTGWSIHSSAGTQTKTGYQAEWNQIVCTWFNHWNHRGWEPHWFKVFMWAVIGVRASAFFNLLSASPTSIIVLPALGWAVRGRLEGWSTQNMTLSLFTSRSLLPSMEGAGEEIEMQCNGAVAQLLSTILPIFLCLPSTPSVHTSDNDTD